MKRNHFNAHKIALVAPILAAILSAGSVSACKSAGFRRAYMAVDSGGLRKRDVFYTDSEAIYCIAELASGRDDVTVVAEIHAEMLISPTTGHETVIDWFVGTEEQAPGRGENITVAFEWEREESTPYPAGGYRCDLFLDGELEASLPFEVRYPDCPLTPIYPQTTCAGFVLADAKCPGAFDTECTCQDEGWTCQ